MQTRNSKTAPPKKGNGNRDRRHFLKMLILTAVAAATSLGHSLAKDGDVAAARPGGISLNGTASAHG
jgi:hypothetical protein